MISNKYTKRLTSVVKKMKVGGKGYRTGLKFQMQQSGRPPEKITCEKIPAGGTFANPANLEKVIQEEEIVQRA